MKHHTFLSSKSTAGTVILVNFDIVQPHSYIPLSVHLVACYFVEVYSKKIVVDCSLNGWHLRF